MFETMRSFGLDIKPQTVAKAALSPNEDGSFHLEATVLSGYYYPKSNHTNVSNILIGQSIESIIIDQITGGTVRIKFTVNGPEDVDISYTVIPYDENKVIRARPNTNPVEYKPGTPFLDRILTHNKTRFFECKCGYTKIKISHDSLVRPAQAKICMVCGCYLNEREEEPEHPDVYIEFESLY